MTYQERLPIEMDDKRERERIKIIGTLILQALENTGRFD